MANYSGIVPPNVLHVGGIVGTSPCHVGRRVLVACGLSVVLSIGLVGLVVVPIVGTVLWIGGSDMELLQVEYLLFKLRQSVIKLFGTDSFLGGEFKHGLESLGQVGRVSFGKLVQQSGESRGVDPHWFSIVYIVAMFEGACRQDSQSDTEYLSQALVYFLVIARLVNVFLVHLLRGYHYSINVPKNTSAFLSSM